MKIIFVSNTSWNLYNFRGNIISALISEGFDVICLCKDERNSSEKLMRLGCKVYHLSSVDARGKNPWREMKLFLEIYRSIRYIQADLTFFYTVKMNIYGGIASSLLRRDYLNNVTGLGSMFCKHNKLPWVIRKLYKWAFSKSRKIIFHNDSDLRYMIDTGVCSKEMTQVIPGSGVNTEWFQTDRKVEGIHTFLFSGRWLKEKGVCEFLEAAIQLAPTHPNVQWVLVGDNYGVPLKDLDELIETARLNSNIYFYPFVEDMRTYYAMADVFVLPSSREGLSKSVLEAMSMERIVVVSDVPGCKDIVSDGNTGFLLPEISASAIKTKMFELMKLSDVQIKKITQSARREVISKYSSEIIVQQYRRLIHEWQTTKKTIKFPNH